MLSTESERSDIRYLVVRHIKESETEMIHFFCYSLLGFSPLLQSSCNSTSGDIRVIYLNETLDLDAFLNPVALLLCYYVLVISSGFILDAKVK